MEHLSIASWGRLPGRGWIFGQRLCSHRTLTCDRGDSLRGNNFCKAGLVPVASRMLQPMPENAPGWCLLFSLPRSLLKSHPKPNYLLKLNQSLLDRPACVFHTLGRCLQDDSELFMDLLTQLFLYSCVLTLPPLGRIRLGFTLGFLFVLFK